MAHAEKEPVRLSAAQYVIDRGWGKPVQQTDMTLSSPDGGPLKHSVEIVFVSKKK
jgi:hypothetical protein